MDKERIIEQVKAIRDTGETNMFDSVTVQRMAFERGFYELVCFIEDDRKAYGKLIFTGKID